MEGLMGGIVALRRACTTSQSWRLFWLHGSQMQGLSVTRNMVAAKALDLLDDLMIPHATFKASLGWVSKFMKRY